jgi:flagellin-like hook-associated protein FlgL
MSGIVVSASVRQNLLALQSTASLLAKTQNDLATGNKINSAVDKPTQYLAAQSLNNRAADIARLLDGISNGVQVLQAAIAGLTSLQRLVDDAKSIASHVLQMATDAKSSVTSAADPNAQVIRVSLVSQYNNLLQHIDTTAQNSSFNGINLLNGDTLNLAFDESGRSTLNIQGVVFNHAGIGLSRLSAAADFVDSDSADKVLGQLNGAGDMLRAESSALCSNLSIVQTREDFNKNLVNVLQTGASNLILADPNEEVARSQAVSTRQSIAVSALALANQSRASVLQLLR